jgi:hypothetical protein
MSKYKKQQYLVFLKEKDGDDEVAFLYSDVERLLELIGLGDTLEDLERYTSSLVWYIVSASSPRNAIKKGYQENRKDLKLWEEDCKEAELEKAALRKQEQKTDPSTNGAKPETTHASKTTETAKVPAAIWLQEWRHFRRLEIKPYVQGPN